MSATSYNVATLALRVMIGFVFVAHGYRHFNRRAKTIEWISSIGLKSPGIQWAFMSLGELGVGLGMLAGFLTAPAAAGVVALMFGAFWTVHRFAGFFVTARPDEGYEYVATLVAGAVALALIGPGEWSLDHAFDIAITGGTAALIAAIGLIAGIGQIAMFYRPDQLKRGSAG
jgi:putative oxidoreductase